MPPFRSLEGIPRNPDPRHPFCQSFCWPRSPPVSPDGSCGGADGYICLGSEFGDCCSAYGYCGSSTGHCTAGCLSAFGTCEEVSNKVSPDGSCGGANGYVCAGSGFGDCCSAYGYCGSESGHCTAGCQGAFGTCESDTFSHLPSGSCPLHSSSLASPPISLPLSPRSHLHSHIRSRLRFYLALTSTLISSASPLLLPRSSSALSPLFRRFTSTLTFPLTSTLTSTFISSVSTVWCDALLNSDATCCSILMRRAAQFRCNGLPDTTHCLMRCAAQL
jgi:hypothetical protein